MCESVCVCVCVSVIVFDAKHFRRMLCYKLVEFG